MSPLSSARERFKQRFSSSGEEEVSAAGRAKVRRQRRKDYKGSRCRLNLRLDQALAEDLNILQLAEGIEKNTFCEEVIHAAVNKRLIELRGKLGEEAWGEVVRRAKGTRTKKHDS